VDPPPRRRRRPGRADPSHRRRVAIHIAFTERLAAAGVSGSVGTVGDAYDNALAESVIGLSKTGLIKPRGPWHTAGQVEIATLEYVDWSTTAVSTKPAAPSPQPNSKPAYYSQNTALAEAGQTAN
jgi:putative transposase